MLYDIKTKQVKQRFELCPAQINKVESTAKDAHIVAGFDNGEVRIYSNTTKQLSQKFIIPKSASCTHLRCHHTKRHLVITGSNHGIVALFDINVKKAMYVDTAHLAPITDVAFSPNRGEIVVSSGRDRKLVYHDVVSRKRISEVNVENSVTALDFSLDGMFLITGSQNGKITIFDIRHVNKPVNSFEAHGKEITNVLFQKQEMSDGNNSVYTINEDISTPETNVIEASDERTCFSFDYSPNVVAEPSPNRSPQRTLDAGDSFMVALGQFENDSRNCSPNPSTATTGSSIGPQLNDTKKMEPPSVSTLKRISSSTPKCLTEEVGLPELSPVVSSNENRTFQPVVVQQNIGITEEQVRQIIKDELKATISSFKREMQQEMYDMLTQLRRNFLDLQMSIVKEFVQVENHFTKLRQDLEADEQDYGEETLQQENYKLRKELMMLKEKLIESHRKED